MILQDDARHERGNDLEALGFNGLGRVIVRVNAGALPPFAELEVHLLNDLHRDTLVAAGDTPARAARLFPIQGGLRIRAGAAVGQVRVLAVAAGPAANALRLRVEPIGDYSTYRLAVDADSIDPALGLPAAAIDPLFAELRFKFRPGCFTNDCAPDGRPGRPRRESPLIDYLAKDYDSFRHAMMAAMMQRVPGWRSTSEADLDQVIIGLTSAVADELSDYQDRVVNEAYLATCRSRISLARHARLMDYHVHQGNQASTWVALEIDPAVVAGPLTLPPRHPFWTGEQVARGIVHRLTGAEVFSTRAEHRLHPLLNSLNLYTWDDAIPALAAGSTTADLAVDPTGLGMTEQQAAIFLAQAINQTDPAQFQVRRLLVQEWLNPLTGTVNGRDPRKRQVLTLLEGGGQGATVVHDVVRNRFLVRVRWRIEDQLRWDYVFVGYPNTVRVAGVSRFHGNLVRAHHGLFATVRFLEPGAPLAPDDPLDPAQPLERHYRRTPDHRHGVLAPLPHAPLAYLPTPVGGETPPWTTLEVEVEVPGGAADSWDERISLVHSDDSEEEGDHFAVETDELQRSTLRFGNGTNGRLLPEGSVVTCRYQVGQGHRGNIGLDQLVNTETVAPHASGLFLRCWNPMDVTDGREPEPAARVLRNAPEAFRARQLRAVTLDDYVQRAEEVPGIARAAAAYRWTGSWRTVRLTLDPAGTTELGQDLRARVAQHLEAVRLMGEDLELRPPRYVPLSIEVSVCVSPDVWPEDVRFLLEQEFSTGYTPDGRRGFFHPDNWTFGQRIHRSEIAGRVHQVPGVEHLIGLVWKRFNEPTPGAYPDPVSGPEDLFVGPDEIVQVQNDPDHLELGFIRFELKGGRQ